MLLLDVPGLVVRQIGSSAHLVKRGIVVATNVILAAKRAFSAAGTRHPNPRQWTDAAGHDSHLSPGATTHQPAGKVAVRIPTPVPGTADAINVGRRHTDSRRTHR